MEYGKEPTKAHRSCPLEIKGCLASRLQMALRGLSISARDGGSCVGAILQGRLAWHEISDAPTIRKPQLHAPSKVGSACWL